MFLLKNRKLTEFKTIPHADVIQHLKDVLSKHVSVYVLFEKDADPASAHQCCTELLKSSNIHGIFVQDFMSMSPSGREQFHGVVFMSPEQLVAAAMSAYISPNGNEFVLPVRPILGLSESALLDDRTTRVVLPIGQSKKGRAWKESLSLIRTAISWLQQEGGAKSAQDSHGDAIHQLFYAHVSNLVDVDTYALRSLSYQSLSACIHVEMNLVSGIHYRVTDGQISWAGLDGQFSDANMQDPIISSVVALKHGLEPGTTELRPEVFDVHPLSMLSTWGAEVVLVSTPMLPLKDVFHEHPSNLSLSDSQRGQNVLLQEFIYKNAHQDIVLLVNDSDYLAGLQCMPPGILVMTHARYLSFPFQHERPHCVALLQMPKSEYALRELAHIFRARSVSHRFILAGTDQRLRQRELEWTMITSAATQGPSRKTTKQVLSFWGHFWRQSVDDAVSKGEQFSLDVEKIRVMSSAFSLCHPDSNGGYAMQPFQLVKKWFLPLDEHKYAAQGKLLEHRTVWHLFLIKIQDRIRVNRLSTIFLPVQLSLSARRTSVARDELLMWQEARCQ